MHKTKKFHLLLALLLLLTSTGCGIKNLSTDGLILAVSERELNDKFKDFPIEKNYVFASIKIEKPRLFIKKGSNKISAAMDTFVSAIMAPKKSGSFIISGIPYFDKKTKSVYLKDISVEKFKISNTPITKEVVNILLSNIKPLIDSAFKQFPIYTLKKSSFLRSSVKDLRIENSELLITFGL